MTEWRVQYGDPADNNYEEELVDIELVTNANPYGDHGTAYISDVDGNRVADYPPRQRVDFEAREFGSGNSWTTMLQGFVVEPRERTENGANRLEVECHSLDQLLRNGDMNGDLSGQRIESALQTLIEDWVDGVNWNGGADVDVQNNVNLERTFTNEKIDNILKALRRRSAGETFGVDGNFNFYFKPRETKTVDRGIGPADWTDYDIPEKAQDALNEVRVFYDDGDKAVIVDDPGDKREIQENLGAPSPVTSAESIMREQITTRADAIAAGEEYLTDRGVPREVQVETWGLVDAEPGDTIPIRLPSADINDEYVIAQLESTLPDETKVTALREDSLTQKSESSTSDMLVRASDSLQRVEMRPARQEGDLQETVRVIETLVGVEVGVGGEVDGTQLETFAITNDGWKALIDAYVGTSTVTISNVLVGTGGTDAARTDTSLGDQSESVGANVSTSGDFDIDVSTSSNFTTGDTVKELGLELSDGTLLLRGTLVDSVSGPDSASATLSVSNDDSIDRSVVTETGQTLVRDVLADNSPTFPDEFALGSGSPSFGDETLTSLATQEATRSLGNEIVVDAGSGDTIDDLVTGSDISADDPASVRNDKLQLDQVAWVWDAQDVVVSGGTTTDDKYTGGEAVNFNDRGDDQIQIIFTPGVGIASSDLEVAIRGDAGGTQSVDIDINGVTMDTLVKNSTDWYTTAATDDDPPVALTAGEENYIHIFGTGLNDVNFDVITVYDSTQVDGSPDGNNGPAWDNDNGNNGDYLTEPHLYPSTHTVELGTGGLIDLSNDVTEASISISTNNTNSDQGITIEGNTSNNTTSATETFSATSSLDTALILSSFGSRSGETPTEDFNGQTISSIQVQTNISDIGVRTGSRSLDLRSYFGPGVISAGTTITEAGVLDTNDTLLSLSDVNFTVESGLTLEMAETLRFRREELPINEPQFDMTITGLSSN